MSMFNKISHSFMYGSHKVTLETGVMARQATAAVVVNIGETVVLVTVVAAKTAKDGQDFFPLTVDYFEKNYAVGKIPGGFLKRETRPADHEILVARLIDRPVRPLFPEGFYNEIQLVAQVISLDPTVGSDIPAIIGASAALCLSGVPFQGPLGAARVGMVEGEYVLNPSKEVVATQSSLDLVVAGTSKAILMVESEAQQLTEKEMLDAIVFGHEHIKTLVSEIEEFVKKVNPVVWDWAAPVIDQALLAKIKDAGHAELVAAYNIRQKQARYTALGEAKAKILSAVLTDETKTDKTYINLINNLIFDLESEIVRSKILSGEPRIDGRDTKTVRPIEIILSPLPTAHGSVLFTRGETQALGIATLGTRLDEQMIESIHGSHMDRFMLNYNFPPFSTGETGRMGAPKRREIGHGNLARRAITPILPTKESFPYTLRVVSEILESNGSSSMATVCATCLSLMDAGVPLKDHVAGVAMGLILSDTKFAVLTDILGDEDHLGDMDFKVAGTDKGITALQMDIKVAGINKQIMEVALAQAKEGRMHILGLMKTALPYPKLLSERVPRLYTMHINPNRIKDVIGKGGAVIKSIIAETGATIDITDEGVVTIASANPAAADKARAIIEDIVVEVVVGQVYDGKVIKLLDKNLGAIVSIMGNRDGFVHISQIAHERVNNVSDYLKLGQEVKVKALEVDEKGRVKLSIKQTLEAPVVETEVKVEETAPAQ